MDLAAIFILIVGAIIVLVEYLTGQIFIFKKSLFPNRKELPDQFWKHFTWHVLATLTLALGIYFQ